MTPQNSITAPARENGRWIGGPYTKLERELFDLDHEGRQQARAILDRLDRMATDR